MIKKSFYHVTIHVCT